MAGTLTVILTAVLTIGSVCGQVNITVKATNALRVHHYALMCCSSQRWRGLVPELRLKVDPDDDYTLTRPPEKPGGEFELCYNISVAAKHHLRQAECMATYLPPNAEELPESFTSSFVMKVFLLTGVRIQQTNSLTQGLGLTASCEATGVSYDNEYEFKLTHSLNKLAQIQTLRMMNTTTDRGYLDSRRKVLAVHDVVSELRYVIPEGIEPEKRMISAGCVPNHLFDRTWSNTTTVTDLPPFPNATATNATATETDTDTDNATGSIETARSKTQVSESSGQLAIMTAVGGGVVAAVGLTALLASVVDWARNKDRPRTAAVGITVMSRKVSSYARKPPALEDVTERDDDAESVSVATTSEVEGSAFSTTSTVA
ncbi:uncharacterized protein [Littorina saxatilis]|uniref:Uncharacterized protein n=1 Tax=Littorina saxatilis TaxID=31220 RepID=A0AAN9G6R3_9CAEN